MKQEYAGLCDTEDLQADRFSKIIQKIRTASTHGFTSNGISALDDDTAVNVRSEQMTQDVHLCHWFRAADSHTLVEIDDKKSHVLYAASTKNENEWNCLY